MTRPISNDDLGQVRATAAAGKKIDAIKRNRAALGWASSSLRMGFLLTLLIGEAALVASLHAFGWFATGGGLRWIGCLLAAVLPLVIAAVVLFRHRFRFGLRMLLVAMALVATFLFITVRPLQIAISARRANRLMLAAGATLHTTSSFDEVYRQLKYDPRPPRSLTPIKQSLPFWLRPLAGNIVAVPTDDSVREIWLDSDEQVAALCGEASTFRNLERISIDPGVTPAAGETLRRTLPELAHLSDIQFDVDVPADWLQSLSGIRTLVMWKERRIARSRLSNEQLRVIAASPELRVLLIFGYANTDADIQILSGSKTLKHVILKKTAVTLSGERQLSACCPDVSYTEISF